MNGKERTWSFIIDSRLYPLSQPHTCLINPTSSTTSISTFSLQNQTNRRKWRRKKNHSRATRESRIAHWSSWWLAPRPEKKKKSRKPRTPVCVITTYVLSLCVKGTFEMLSFYDYFLYTRGREHQLLSQGYTVPVQPFKKRCSRSHGDYTVTYTHNRMIEIDCALGTYTEDSVVEVVNGRTRNR
jgi:hypothetical protein